MQKIFNRTGLALVLIVGAAAIRAQTVDTTCHRDSLFNTVHCESTVRKPRVDPLAREPVDALRLADETLELLRRSAATPNMPRQVDVDEAAGRLRDPNYEALLELGRLAEERRRNAQPPQPAQSQRGRENAAQQFAKGYAVGGLPKALGDGATLERVMGSPNNDVVFIVKHTAAYSKLNGNSAEWKRIEALFSRWVCKDSGWTAAFKAGAKSISIGHMRPSGFISAHDLYPSSCH